MAKKGTNPDREFFRDLLLPFVENGASSLPLADVGELERRLSRADLNQMKYAMSQDAFSTDRSFFLLPKTANKNQVPAVAVACDFTSAIPSSIVLLSLNVVEGSSVRTLGIRFECAELDPAGAIGSHSFPHAQLTSKGDLKHVHQDGDAECHDTNFASYPALFGAASNPGDLLLTTFVSVYGLSDLLGRIDPTSHWDLRREVLERLRRLLPAQIADKLPSV